MSDKALAAATGSPYFALHTLGWRAFQDLCAAVLRHVWGQSVQAFADSNDAGRDGAFYGDWSPALGGAVDSIPHGPFVLQCKHSKNPDSTLSESMLQDEFKKTEILVRQGLCSSYILLTNSRVTGAAEGKIRKRLLEAGVKHPLVLDGQWISDIIATHRGLRMFVPRVYGLGDLSQILDERAYQQASTILAAEQISSFVPTAAYKQAVTALSDHGFVLLLGEPGVGKSAIALMLAIGAADRWNGLVVKARDSRQLIQQWNPNEKDQLFWVDDAFGTVRHEERLSEEWSRDMPHVMGAIRNGARVILTSRSYIYREARPLLKTYAYPLLREQQVTVDVADITPAERQQMLYNHLARGDQPSTVRAQMKPHLKAAAAVNPFLPEAARRLGLQAFTRNLNLNRSSITTFIARPHEYLQDVYDQLTASSLAALALVYSAGSHGVSSTLSLKRRQRRVIESVGATVGEIGLAFTFLNESFLRLSQDRFGNSVWNFRHPTLQEGFATWLSRQHHLVPVVLEAMDDNSLLDSTDAMIADATPVRGTVLRLPPTLYATASRRMLRLFEEWPDGSCWTGSALRYLAHRSSDEMLRTYIAVDPLFAGRLLEFDAFASFVQEPLLLSRLHSMGLLSDDDRRAACNRMAYLAINYLDAAWLEDEPWKILLAPHERERLLAYVRAKILPVIDRMIDEDWPARAFWRSHDEDGDSPVADPVERALNLYLGAFRQEGDAEAVDAFSRASQKYQQIRRTSEADAWDSIQEPPISPADAQPGDGGNNAGERSVFSDLD
ncbi:hypothetical protein AB0J72_08640 [Dactylosporangium sp. NPDC049742]|uniref:nSTAND3 domain-containing NTPase n=1 Tax=Dactylosporangium sp. NPDC049742 TaxID=3154737 RepID=UPI00341FF481